MPARRLPFQGLKLRQWLNLLWAGLFLFYISFVVIYMVFGGMCDYLGADFRAFYSSAQIAQSRGFAQVYDLTTQETFQRPLYAQCPSANVPYTTVPMPYMPAFVLLFMPLLLLPYIPAYYVWISLNLALLVLYMWRFSRAVGNKDGWGIALRLIVSVQVFSNMLLGQVNVLLLVCLGEFLLANLRPKLPQTACDSFLENQQGATRLPASARGNSSRLGILIVRILRPAERLLRDNEFHGGLWLGGLLLKPQTLILLLPGLLLKRRFNALAGFTTTTLVIGGISMLQAGGYGLGDLILLILHYVRGLPTNAPEAMMNWRALAINLGTMMHIPVAWVLAMVGMALTILFALALWLWPVDLASPRFALLLLATYAATCAATWHAHVHMVLPMIPLILLLYTKGRLPWSTLFLWLLGPGLVFPLALLLKPDIAYSAYGTSSFALNLYLLGWAACALWRNHAPEEHALDVDASASGNTSAPSGEP